MIDVYLKGIFIFVCIMIFFWLNLDVKIKTDKGDEGFFNDEWVKAHEKKKRL